MTSRRRLRALASFALCTLSACGTPSGTSDAADAIAADAVVANDGTSNPDGLMPVDARADVAPPEDTAPADPCATEHCPAHSTCHVVDATARCSCDVGYLQWMSACSADADHDGLSEDEELQFATEVAPALWFDASESYSGRRTFWAVTPGAGGGRSAFFAHGYYNDGGSILGVTSHLGDSEFIVVTRSATGETHLFLSAHYQASTDASAWYPVSAFETAITPDGRTRPAVWVAYSKHGNYPDLATCDAGALHTDSCGRGTLEAVPVEAARNLGQSWSVLVDSAPLDMPDRRTEYFWTDARFCGWQVVGGLTADRSGCAPLVNSYVRELVTWESGML